MHNLGRKLDAFCHRQADDPPRICRNGEIARQTKEWGFDAKIKIREKNETAGKTQHRFSPATTLPT
jgi:hypothetical protein